MNKGGERKRKLNPVPEKPPRGAQRARETLEPAHPGSTSSLALSADVASSLTEDLTFIDPAFAALQRQLRAFRDTFLSRDKFQFIGAAFDDLDRTQRDLRLKLEELVLVSAFLERQGATSAPSGVFSALPLELILHILSFLSPRDLLSLTLVSRHFSRLSRDDALWRRHVLLQRFSLPLPHLSSPHLPPLLSQFACQNRIAHRWRTAPRTQRTLIKHTSQVSCAQFLDDLIVSGGFDRRIVIWPSLDRDRDPHVLDRTTAGDVHEDRVLCLHLSSRDQLSTGGRDESVRLWDLQALRCVRTLRGHTDNVWWLRRVGDVVVSASADKTVRVWDARVGECVHRHEAHGRGLSCLHYEPSTGMLVTGSADKTVKVWDVRVMKEMREVRVLVGHEDAVYCLYVHGGRMVSGGEDQKMCMWDLQTGELKYRIQDVGGRGGGGVYCVQFDERKLVRGAYNSSVKVWDIEGDRPKEVVDFSGAVAAPQMQPARTVTSPMYINHSDTVRAVQFDDFKMVTASADKTVKIWNFL